MARSAPLTITVLGGTGFVGTEIVSRLAAAGHWVRVPTRVLSRGRHLQVLPTVELSVANIHDRSVLGRLLAGADVVVNLVGILNEPGRSGAGFRAAHAELAQKVVEAARSARVPRLLHMSSLGADSQSGPSHYLRSKGDAEAAVRAAPAPIAWTIFRPSIIFGARDSFTTRFAGLLRLSRGFMPLPRAGARFAPIHVDDVVAAFLRALDDPSTAGQAYDLCGPEVFRFDELIRLIGDAARIRARVVPVPDALARVQALLGDFVPGKPFSSDNFRSLTVDNVCRENGCARLGIEPRSLRALLPLYLGPDPVRERLASAGATQHRR